MDAVSFSCNNPVLKEEQL